MHHTTEIPVRGYHIDLYGHVSHTRYLELLEEARWRLFGERMDRATLNKTESPLVVVNVNIDYRAPAKVYDTLVIETSTESIGRTSAVLRQQISIQEKTTIIADARVTFVAVDPRSQKPIPIAGALRALLEDLR